MLHQLHLPLVYAASFRARHHQTPLEITVVEDQLATVETVDERGYPVVLTLQSERGTLRWRQRLSDGLILREVAIQDGLTPAPLSAFSQTSPADVHNVLTAGSIGWSDHPSSLNVWQDPFGIRSTSAATRHAIEFGQAVKWIPNYRFWKWVDASQRALREEALHRTCQDLVVCAGALLKPAAEPVIVVEATGSEVRIRRVAPPLLDYLGTACSFFRADEEAEAIECAHLIALDREVYDKDVEVHIDNRRIDLENGYSLRAAAPRHLALLGAIQDHRMVLGASTPHDAMAFGLAFDALRDVTATDRTEYALARLAEGRGADLKNFRRSVGALERAAVKARQNMLERRAVTEFEELPPPSL